MLNLQNNYRYVLTILLSLVILFVPISIYFYFHISKTSQSSVVVDDSSPPFSQLRNLEVYKRSEALLKENNPQQAYTEFSSYLANNPLDQGGRVDESAALYAISLRRKYDRDQSYTDYYNFFRNDSHSNLNRSYAGTMAIQQALANGEFRKLLIFLSEDEVRNLKEISSREVVYMVSKKMFALDSFPLTAVRLASYEIRQEPNPERKQEVYNKYLFRFYERVEANNSDPGLRHLNANALLNLGQLQSNLEDFKIVGATTTAKTFEDAYNYSILYSPKLTQEYVLLAIIEHAIKHDNLDRAGKVVKVFEEAKTVSTSIQNIFRDLNVLKRDYPNTFNKVNFDSEFKERLFKAVRA